VIVDVVNRQQYLYKLFDFSHKITVSVVDIINDPADSIHWNMQYIVVVAFILLKHVYRKIVR